MSGMLSFLALWQKADTMSRPVKSWKNDNPLDLSGPSVLMTS